jgi:predicted PurR-regulated permease PerM
MLFLPLSVRLEKKLPKIVAVLIAMLVLLCAIGLMVFILTRQASNISDNAVQIERNISQKFQEVHQFVTNSLGISKEKSEAIFHRQQESSSGKISGILSGLFFTIGGVLTDFLIIIIYVFLFLYFHDHFKKFVLQLVPQGNRKNAQTIMHDVRKVAQKYLTGLALMIACLWVMYGIGFSIAGVKNALFYAILCGLLEIVPFVGNLTGVTITLIMSLAQGGNTGLLIAILVTYGLVQFIQSYLLEPLIVGREISIHPVFTIVGIVGGELLWGISGMILALPLLGIIKIICDHVELLKPYGYLIGHEKKKKASLRET